MRSQSERTTIFFYGKFAFAFCIIHPDREFALPQPKVDDFSQRNALIGRFPDDNKNNIAGDQPVFRARVRATELQV